MQLPSRITHSNWHHRRHHSGTIFCRADGTLLRDVVTVFFLFQSYSYTYSTHSGLTVGDPFGCYNGVIEKIFLT